MSVSEAKKRANARWNASKDNIMIRPTKEEGTAIRSAAAAAGQSNQQYILQATRERMERDGGGTAPETAGKGPESTQRAGVVSLPSETLETALRASEAVGEALPNFIRRAVETQAQRDKNALRLGINPTTGDKLEKEV